MTIDKRIDKAFTFTQMHTTGMWLAHSTGVLQNNVAEKKGNEFLKINQSVTQA